MKTKYGMITEMTDKQSARKEGRFPAMRDRTLSKFNVMTSGTGLDESKDKRLETKRIALELIGEAFDAYIDSKDFEDDFTNGADHLVKFSSLVDKGVVVNEKEYLYEIAKLLSLEPLYEVVFCNDVEKAESLDFRSTGVLSESQKARVNRWATLLRGKYDW